MKKTRDQRFERFMLGLAISGATLAPGATRTLDELAAYCGCTRQNVWAIENRAIQKLRSYFMEEIRDGTIDLATCGNSESFQFKPGR